MGIELPKELADVAAATGLSWPQADEDKLREQAGAWRAARAKVTSLATDADRTAGGAVGALSGTAAEAAGKQWSGYVHPDHGTLTTTVRGAGEAADRLDHAADQVAAAKVEMVRQLVNAAKNRDAAQAAASAGHPAALLGLDTVLRGTAANLSAVTHRLAGAVGGGSGSSPGLVDPNPGAHTRHGQAGLLSTVTGLPVHVVSAVGRVDDVVRGTVDRVAAPLAPNLAGHAVPGVAHAAGGVVDGVAHAAGGLVDSTASGVAHVAGGVVDGAVSAAGHTAEDLTGSTMDTPRNLPRQPAAPAPGADADAGTGPIQVPNQPAMPSHTYAPPPPALSQHGGFFEPGGFDDVVTPPSGTPHQTAMPPHVPGVTVVSGFADTGYAPPPAPSDPAFVPGSSPAPSPQPGYVPPFSPGPSPGTPLPVAGGPVAGGGPVLGGPVAPPLVGGGGSGVRGTPVPGAGGGPPVAGGPVAGGPVAPPAVAGGGSAVRGMPVPGVGGVSGLSPGQPAADGPRHPQRIEPQPPAAAHQEAPRPPIGAPRQDRESIVALFGVHMFPIGHLPVAADRPACQLPVPPPEVDYAPGLRFPPHDHPRSELIDSWDALDKVGAGLRRLPTPFASPPAALTEAYDPLAGLHERDWDRRFLAGLRDSVPEYAWPPGERYPEGGYAAGEPELLAEGTLLDRFGDVTGRVFAPEGTPFAHRSLPPSALETGYRRYRVLREVPMWKALSAGWFGQPGGGVRYRAIYSADELVTMGFLADVTVAQTHGDTPAGARDDR